MTVDHLKLGQGGMCGGNIIRHRAKQNQAMLGEVIKARLNYTVNNIGKRFILQFAWKATANLAKGKAIKAESDRRILLNMRAQKHDVIREVRI
jgi:hypothetical protein